MVQIQTGIISIIGAFIGIGLLLTGSVLLLQRQVVRPVQTIERAARAVSGGDLAQTVPLTGHDEIASLQRSFNHMVASLREQHHLLEQRSSELAKERAALEDALQQLQAVSEERTRLLENTVVQLSAPILSVLKGVLVMPIIGAVNLERARQLQETLLYGIEAKQVRLVILDLTALHAVDEGVVSSLMQMVRSAQLLGAHPVVVGINPQIAEALVRLDVSLSDLHTMSDLAAAVSYAMRTH
jgi:anti-anti-sigma regulatory factor/HAMP domain-containing protein